MEKLPVRCFKFLSSLKLSIIVIAFMIVLAVPATIIPQHYPTEFYPAQYGSGSGSLILMLGYDHYFSSPLFMIVIAFFGVNLFACSWLRLIRQLKRGRGWYFGPDIIHFGLLVLIAGALITYAGRQEAVVFLSPGECLPLPGGTLLCIDELHSETWADGRPKDWITRGQLIPPEGQGERKDFEITVNGPLRVAGMALYQNQYRRDENGEGYETGLLMTYDPGKTVFLVALGLITAGVCTAFFQKRRGL